MWRWIALPLCVLILAAAVFQGCVAPMELLDVSPRPGQSGVSLDAKISIALSRPVRSGHSLSLLPPVSGTLLVDDTKVVFLPEVLLPGVRYTATYSNPRLKGGSFSWSFVTEGVEEPFPSAPAVVLTAGPFERVTGLSWYDDERLVAALRSGSKESISLISIEGDRTDLLSLFPNSFFRFYVFQDRIYYSNQHTQRTWWLPAGETEPREILPGLVFHPSPDGSKVVAYGTSRAGQSAARMWDSHTGSVRELAGVAVKDFPFTGLGNSWSPDSAFYLCVSADGTRGFSIIHSATGEAIYTSDSGSNPVWSKQGASLAFFNWVGEQPTLFVVELYSGDILEVPLPQDPVTPPVWSAEGELIAVAAGNNVYVYNLVEGDWRHLAEFPKDVFSVPQEFSPGGDYLLVTTFSVDLSRLGEVLIDKAGGLTDLGQVDRVLWLDHSTLVIKHFFEEMGSEIWLVDAQSGLPLHPLSPSGWLTQPGSVAISPTGEYVAFTSATASRDREYIFIVSTGISK